MTEPKAVRLARWMSQNTPEVVHKAAKTDKHIKEQWRKTQQHAPSKRMEMLLQVCDTEMSKITAPMRLPCKAGCNHCCTSQTISIHHEEMVLLAKHMKKTWTTAQWKTLKERALDVAPTDDVHNQPCIFLGEKGCSVYVARPMGCRPYHSLSEQACRDKLHTKNTPISSPVLPHSIAQSYQECVNFQGPLYEMNSLIQRIAENNDWEAWTQQGVLYSDLVLDLNSRIESFEKQQNASFSTQPPNPDEATKGKRIDVTLVPSHGFELHGDSNATI